MPGKTISAYADAETARRVEALARIEDRAPSQIAAAALRFYLRLPPDAHDAIRQVEALGDAHDVEALVETMTRDLLKARSEVSLRKMADAMADRGIGAELDDEAAIEAEAVRLTRPERWRR